MKIIAHRGNSKYFPENTLASYKSALELEADIIETDIRLSSDGIAVIIHDDNTERTTGINKIIKNTTLTEITSLEASYTNRFGNIFKGEKIPTVKEALVLFKERNAKCILEFKDIEACNAVKSDIETTDFPEENAIIFVWNNSDLKKAFNMFKKAPIYHLSPINDFQICKNKENYFKEIITLGLKGFSVNFNAFLEMKNKDRNTFTILARKYKMPIFVWTIDDPEQMKKAIDFKAEDNVDGKTYIEKISGIISNDPQIAYDIIRKHH